MINKEELENTIKFLHKISLKCSEINVIWRDGKSIVAYEKFGGITKNIHQLIDVLQNQLNSLENTDISIKDES